MVAAVLFIALVVTLVLNMRLELQLEYLLFVQFWQTDVSVPYTLYSSWLQVLTLFH